MLRRGEILACLGAAAFLLAVGAPFIGTLKRQILLMVPSREGPDRRLYQDLDRRRRLDPQLRFVAQSFELADRGAAAEHFRRLQESNTGNGLPGHLRLLSQLPAQTQPASGGSPETASLTAQLRAAVNGPPVRTQATRLWDLAFRVATSPDKDVRESCLQADILARVFGRREHRVMRLLGRRLLEQSRAWRETGRPEDAAWADLAAARLSLDLIEDSPRPDQALMASTCLAEALRNLAANPATAAVADSCSRQARQVAEMRVDWHSRVPDDAINLIPAASSGVRARREHDHVLKSLGASVCGLTASAALLLMCVVLLPFSARRGTSDESLRWRAGWKGRLLAVATIAGPVGLVICMAGQADGTSYTWIISSGSLGPSLLAPLVILVLTGLASRLAVDLPAGHARALISRQALTLVVCLYAAVVLACLLMPTGRQAWHPPAAVQYYRRLAMALGGLSLVVWVVWIAWGSIRRERRGLAYGPWAAANLGTAAWSLAVIAGFTLLVMGVNHRRDAAHREAYVTAATDPVADRLGPDWRGRYLQGTGESLADAVARLPRDG